MRNEFVTGLVNIHAVEKQAMQQLMQRQIERNRDYPEVAARLRRHLDETNMQHERLDRLLSQFGAAPSTLKDLMMQASANMAALMHAASDDEILKNTFRQRGLREFRGGLLRVADRDGGDRRYQDAIAPCARACRRSATWRNGSTTTWRW